MISAGFVTLCVLCLCFQCVGHSWYLSVDMQLFIASPPFIYMLHRYKHKALAIPLALCLLSIVLTMWLSVEHNLTVKLISADG